MSKFTRILHTYEVIHQVPANRLSHAIGIPIIMVAIIGLGVMFDVDGIAHLNGGVILVLATFAIAYSWSWRAAAAYLPVVAATYAVGFWAQGQFDQGTAALVFAAAFVGGWIIQFAGHYFEGHAPEFTSRPANLLLGPISVGLELLPWLRPAPETSEYEEVGV
jgi:uncharacterized membrane protein YGL010W